MAVPAKEMEAEADLVDLFAPGGFVTTLNSVHITGPQMRAAVETIAHIPVRSEADVAEHGRLLGLFASDYGFAPAAYAGMALHARAIAMDRSEEHLSELQSLMRISYAVFCST